MFLVNDWIVGFGPMGMMLDFQAIIVILSRNNIAVLSFQLIYFFRSKLKYYFLRSIGRGIRLDKVALVIIMKL